MNKYTRRENTDFWRTRFRRLIWDGESLKEIPLESIANLDELKEYKNRIDEWVSEIAHMIHKIFEDESLIDEFARPVEDVDFENDSWHASKRSSKLILTKGFKGLTL